MDTATLEAQHREAEAELARAQISIETAQQPGETAGSRARGGQRHGGAAAKPSVMAAERRLTRSETAATKVLFAETQVDEDRARVRGRARRGQRRQGRCGGGGRRYEHRARPGRSTPTQPSIRRRPRSTASRPTSTTARLRRRATAGCSTASPQPGEVLARGRPGAEPGRSQRRLHDLLSADGAGRARRARGRGAHRPRRRCRDVVIPAHITFVADVAQFTPKTVETAEERQKLMFRLKAQIPPELLRKYIRHGQDRPARSGLRAAGPERRVAGQPEAVRGLCNECSGLPQLPAPERLR